MSVSLNVDAVRSDVVRQDLTERYNCLNKLWEKAEAELRSIPLPVDVHVTYKTEKAYDQPESWEMVRFLLGFHKIGDSWRIGVATEHDGWPDERPIWRPIVECPLEERLDATSHFGKLRQAVLDSAESFVEKVDSAIASLKSSLR